MLKFVDEITNKKSSNALDNDKMTKIRATLPNIFPMLCVILLPPSPYGTKLLCKICHHLEGQHYPSGNPEPVWESSVQSKVN